MTDPDRDLPVNMVPLGKGMQRVFLHTIASALALFAVILAFVVLMSEVLL